MSVDVRGRRYSVVGLARSGVAAANALARLGANVFASDQKSADDAHALVATLDPAVEVAFGGNRVRPGDTVVMSPGVWPNAPIFREAEEAGCRIISEIQLFQELRPDAPVLAITGTDGKSTTTSWLGAICYRERPTFVGGNIGIPLSGAVLDLAPGQLVVAEVSNAQLMTAPAFHPKVAVVTNIAPEHLDFHGGFDAYVAAKHVIIENLGAGDTALLRRDPLLGTWRAPVAARTAWFSREPLPEGETGVFVRDDRIVARFDGPELDVVAVSELALPGRHNLENAMAAAGAALAFGIDITHVRDGLRHFTGLEHRLERVRTVRGVTWWNDSKATNPHAAMAGFTAFPEPFVVLAGGYAKGADFAEWADRVVAGCRHAVLNGNTAEAMERALGGRLPVTRVGKLAEAVAVAFELARPGESVVLSPACSSFDQFKDFEHRGRSFKDQVNALPDGMA